MTTIEKTQEVLRTIKNKKAVPTIDLTGNNRLHSLFVDYEQLIVKKKELEEQIEVFRAEICSYLEKEEEALLVCGEYKAKKIFTKGNVDYSQIPALQFIDLDQYRKDGRYSVRI